MYQTTVKPTIVVVVDFVAASLIVVAAAFTYHQCKHHQPNHSSALLCTYFAC
jgi:hypothetical protein